MDKFKMFFKKRIEKQKGSFPHSSLFDFCKALPDNDGRWLWWNIWILMLAESVLFVCFGVVFGLILGEHIK